MKIALVSDAVAPFNKGGKETRIYHLTKYLVGHGHEVHIYTMRWWSQGDVYHLNGVTYHAVSKLYPLYAGERRSIKQGVLFSINCLKLVREDFDIMEVDHMPFFPLFAGKIVCLIKRRPMYATWHEVWGLPYWRQYLGFYKGSIAYLIERLSVLLPNKIIAVSKQTELELRTKLGYKRAVSVVANAVDMAEIKALKASDTSCDILYAGRLLKHKNVDVLIQAIQIVVKQNPAITVSIVGDGPEFDNLKALVDDLQLGAYITLHGFLDSSAEVLTRMKSAKVFVLPSSREGFGISLLEALASGCRVITVDEPSNAARFLVDNDNGEVCQLSELALSSAIVRQLNLPEPQIMDDSYDWSKSGQMMARIYDA